MKINGKSVWIFENPNVYDRYTIITEESDVWGCSDNPYHPQGVAGYGCNITTDLRWCNTVKEYIDEAKASPKWLGRIVTNIEMLPDEVQKWVNQITTEV